MIWKFHVLGLDKAQSESLLGFITNDHEDTHWEDSIDLYELAYNH